LLPIDAFIPDIIKQLTQHNALVLQAEPGAGKSTAVPLALMQSGMTQGKKIVMLEPRRVAARSIATYLASLLGEKVGQRVGYHIRNEHKTSSQTQLEIVTEGVLTRRLQQDPELSDVGLVIFDEFHERSLHADLALMLTLETQDAYREDLKLLVMSATIDTHLLSNYLHQAPVIQCPGRTFPVSIEYQGKNQRYLSDHVMSALRLALRVTQQQQAGDILVFLPGQADIKRCFEAAQHDSDIIAANIECTTLYGALPLAEQAKVLSKNSAARRIIFSTNIAETSLTIEGITIVIDSGLEKTLSYDVKSGLSRLETTRISKASATQRAGRAGRLQAGHCIRLWSESEQQSLGEFQPEEITTSELTDLVLELSAWGITQFDDANWLTIPPRHHFDVACALNQSLGLLDSNNRITPLGQQALSFGITPRLAAMLLQCKTTTEKQLGCLLVSLMNDRDILFNANSADITARVVALNDYIHDKASIKSIRQINRGAIEQAKTTAFNLAKKLGVSLSQTSLTLNDIQSLSGPILFNAFPDRLAQSRSSQTKPSNSNTSRTRQPSANGNHESKYLLANGRGVSLNSDDPLQGTRWMVVCDCDGKNKDGMIYLCATLEDHQIDDLLNVHSQTEITYGYDEQKSQITGTEIRRYRAIKLQETTINSIPKSAFSQCVKDIIQQKGLRFLHWTAQCESWLVRAKWLSDTLDDFPNISESHLLEQLNSWLLPYLSHVSSIKQLQQTPIFDLLTSNLPWEAQQLLEKEAPEHYITPSDKRVAIRYDEHQGPTVSVILQEMFGQIRSPKIALHRVALRFELLSPARRPIQTTSDLEHFWQSSYLEVAKEMRGRYPKHRWPENALEAKPGKSIKLKK